MQISSITPGILIQAQTWILMTFDLSPQQKYFNAIIYTDRPGWNANFTGTSLEHSRNLNSKMEVGWRAQAAIWCLSLEV